VFLVLKQSLHSRLDSLWKNIGLVKKIIGTNSVQYWIRMIFQLF